MRPVRVIALLAAYRGERYIAAQIQSILRAGRPGIAARVIVSDDSGDGKTAQIVAGLASENVEYSSEINTGNRGYQSNFSALCRYGESRTEADYYCFADQDDIWHEEKLEALLPLFDGGQDDTPQLVHSDLRVVDKQLRPIAPSFLRFQGLPSAASHQIPELLHQNIVTGCAAVFNRALLEVITPIPECAVVHDHWLALCADYLGQLKFLDRPLVDYRQHGGNSIGATSLAFQQSYFRPHLYRILWRFPRHLAQAVEQAKALELRAQERGIATDPEKRRLVREFASLKERPYFQRILSIKVFFKGRRSIAERVYLHLVFALLPYLKVRKFEDGPS
jgi:glycosyltransferase involved in cell wall biosynthesis